MVAGVGAVFAWFGLREFKQMRGDKLPWVAIIYPSVIPICCLAGIHISIWLGARGEEATRSHECAAIDGS